MHFGLFGLQVRHLQLYTDNLKFLKKLKNENKEKDFSLLAKSAIKESRS